MVHLLLSNLYLFEYDLHGILLIELKQFIWCYFDALTLVLGNSRKPHVNELLTNACFMQTKQNQKL